jgi:Fe-S cluster assembly protein SufD
MEDPVSTSERTSDPAVRYYEERFARFEESLNGERQSAFHGLRRSGIASFAALGFPTTKHEEWRFTNVGPIAKERFDPLTSARPVTTEAIVAQSAIDGAIRLVVVNGHVDPLRSETTELPPGVIVSGLREAMRRHPALVARALGTLVRGDENAFTALNSGFLLDGAFVYVPHGVQVGRPVQILMVAADEQRPMLIQPRNVVLLEDGSRLTISEHYIHSTATLYLTNSVTEIVLGAHAVLEHDRLQIEYDGAFHVGTMAVRQGEGSEFTSNAVHLGGSIVRNAVGAVFNGPHATCTLNGLSISGGTQLIDNQTSIDHAVPDCASHELYKAVLDGRSRGVFNGKIFVRKDAQKTDAKQTNKTLLLSDDATIDTKPQLEILADDVKCTHGATVGQLDEEQVFYLRSRGIGEQNARTMLTVAFAADVVGRIHLEPLRRRIDELVRGRLAGGTESNEP